MNRDARKILATMHITKALLEDENFNQVMISDIIHTTSRL